MSIASEITRLQELKSRMGRAGWKLGVLRLDGTLAEAATAFEEVAAGFTRHERGSFTVSSENERKCVKLTHSMKRSPQAVVVYRYYSPTYTVSNMKGRMLWGLYSLGPTLDSSGEAVLKGHYMMMGIDSSGEYRTLYEYRLPVLGNNYGTVPYTDSSVIELTLPESPALTWDSTGEYAWFAYTSNN